MKLPSVFSCAVLILLLLASSSATANALQNQAAREQELSAALRAGNGIIIIGGTDDSAFTLRARNRIHRHLSIQDAGIFRYFPPVPGNPDRKSVV